MTYQFEDTRLTDIEIEIFLHIFEVNDQGKFISTINNLSDILDIGDKAARVYSHKVMSRDVEATICFKKDCPNLDELISEMLYFYLESNCTFEISGQVSKEVKACI
jgi:hypothetical protein